MLIDKIRESLVVAFNKDEDNHVENILEESLIGFKAKISMFESMEWSDEGKFQNGAGVAIIEVENEKFYAEVSQCRSGSYYEDYYYSNANLDGLSSEQEFNEPNKVFEFSFRGKTIIIKSDGSAMIMESKFSSVEEAINSLI